jgi:hypothetical protein
MLEFGFMPGGKCWIPKTRYRVGTMLIGVLKRFQPKAMGKETSRAFEGGRGDANILCLQPIKGNLICINHGGIET